MGEHDFAYVHTDIPEGMTIREWRAQRAIDRARARDSERAARRARARARLRRPIAALARVIDAGLGSGTASAGEPRRAVG